jgi:zona occludens toxin
MAINAYIGLMGSGKSFEVVSSVILPAVLAGRRVVTNIDGINPPAIADHLVTVKGAKRDQLGEIVFVTRDQITEPGFFPDELNPEQPSIVQGGDLVCIDECWNFWGTDNKIPDGGEHMRFFRMHRHYTHPATAVSCDLALMIQDLGTLNRKIRAVIELTTRTVKLKSLGAPKAYRIELFEGNKTTKLAKIDTFVKLYDKAIFPLYKSYAAGTGTENTIDKRQNILTNPRLWIMAVLVLGLLSAGAFFVYRFFQPTAQKSGSVQPGSQTASASPMPVKPSETGDFSSEWRYGGSFTANGGTWAVVMDPFGRVRVESPSVFSGKGIASFGIVDGRKVTAYSGPNPSLGAVFPIPPPQVQGQTK